MAKNAKGLFKRNAMENLLGLATLIPGLQEAMGLMGISVSKPKETM